MTPRRLRRTLCLGLALLLAPLGLVAPADAAVSPCPSPTRQAGPLATQLAKGEPVVLRGVTLVGDIELPAEVRAPLVLESSCLRGDLIGPYASFSHVVDLLNTRIEGRVSLAGAQFDAPVTLDAAEFVRGASFSGAEFHGRASFSTASWAGPADFSGTWFERRADFAAAHFDATEPNDASANFSRATFDDGASFFLATVASRAEFALVSSSGELAFHSFTVRGAKVPKGQYTLSFSTARLLGPVSFAGAAIHGPIIFDQAEISALDLSGADLGDTVRLPVGPENTGNLGALRLDLDDADRLVGPSGGDDHAAQRAALALAEATARAGDDLQTANDARVRRLTIARHDRGEPAESLDLAFNFGIWGYGVRPFHQLLAIAAVLLIGAGARWATRLRERPSAELRLGGAVHDLGESLQSLLRLHAPERPWAMAEYLVFKVLVVIFVLNAANVWPVSRDLIQGIF